MTTWTNWSGTVTAEVAVARPGSISELAETVAAAAARGQRVKPIGAGHSFTAIGATDGVQLRLDRLSGIVHADRDTGLVTVSAGTRLQSLNDALWQLGLALPNLGDVDVQTVSGALSTGTHGTGARLGGLVTQVRAVELVHADGTVRRYDAADDPHVFPAVQLGLGALGVLGTVTMQCVPTFALAAAEEPAGLDDVLADLDELLTGNDHVEFYWFPHTRRVLLKRNNRVLDGTALRPVSRMRRLIDDEFLSNTVFERVNRITTRRPSLIPRANAVAARALTARRYVDRSYHVFCSPRRVVFREMEYAVPRDALGDLLDGIAAYLHASGEQVGFPVEVRFAAADDVWLSTAQGRDTAYVAVHQYHRREHEPYFRAVEAVATELGGRPHWGKLHHRDAASLRGVYPHLDDFVAVRERLDPQRVFGNPYLEQVLGDTAPVTGSTACTSPAPRPASSSPTT